MQDRFHYENFNKTAEESQIQQNQSIKPDKNRGSGQDRKKCMGTSSGKSYVRLVNSSPDWLRLAIRCRCTFVVLASASSGERTRELFVRPSPPMLHRRPRPSAFVGCANEATLSSLNTCSPPAQARARRSVVGPRCSLRVSEHIRRSL